MPANGNGISAGQDGYAVIAPIPNHPEGNICQMNKSGNNRFEDFFADDQYLELKNYLYNYLLRKRAVQNQMKHEKAGVLLEIGSGISPLADNHRNVIYTDLSFEAIHYLKKKNTSGYFVVADGKHLPIKSHTCSHVICSEVLEHLDDDRPAIEEIHRILKNPGGKVMITFPHRRWYFAYDDRYVNHYRRYEIPEIKQKLQSAGLEPVVIRKVLGPMEKITMIPVAYIFSNIAKHRAGSRSVRVSKRRWLIGLVAPLFKWLNFLYMGLAWLDARIMPQSLAAVILIESAVAAKKS